MSLFSKVRDNVLVRRLLGFAFHIIGIVVCYYLAFLIRFDFELDPRFVGAMEDTIGWLVLLFVLLIVVFRLYQGLWRFFTFRDCLITAQVFALGSLLMLGLVYLVQGASYQDYPRSVLVVFYLVFLAWEIGGRGFVRVFREWRIAKVRAKEFGSQKRVIVIGDTAECDQAIRALERQSYEMGKVVALFSDAKAHVGSKIHGVPIYGNYESVGEWVERLDADSIVILPPFTSPNKIKEIVDSVAESKATCDFRVLPSYDDIATGRVDIDRIRRVEIDDLLERPPYEVDYEHLQSFIRGKKVMVTGAGGSIGAEICRQLIKLNPATLVLFEVSEFLLFEVERELGAAGSEVEIIACAGDVRSSGQVKRAMEIAGGINVIFHAAAYKHVDLMERNPEVCFQNNVFGTENVARIAEESDVSDFVLVSTDKSVRPTSLMGASKRIAERCLMEREVGKTRFKAVRFGNVLGSSGSVVPIFKEQIASGGPVTVTSEDVTRFFMTIPEAVELVLAAGSQEVDRRIFVLEMGNPVKIDSLARRMIELSGFIPNVDINIEYIGLKKGEKKYEELLTDDEDVERTALDRIWVVRKDDSKRAEEVQLDQLKTLIEKGEEEELRNYVHRLIPGSRLLDGVANT